MPALIIPPIGNGPPGERIDRGSIVRAYRPQLPLRPVRDPSASIRQDESLVPPVVVPVAMFSMVCGSRGRVHADIAGVKRIHGRGGNGRQDCVGPIDISQASTFLAVVMRAQRSRIQSHGFAFLLTVRRIAQLCSGRPQVSCAGRRGEAGDRRDRESGKGRSQDGEHDRRFGCLEHFNLHQERLPVLPNRHDREFPKAWLPLRATAWFSLSRFVPRRYNLNQDDRDFLAHQAHRRGLPLILSSALMAIILGRGNHDVVAACRCG